MEVGGPLLPSNYVTILHLKERWLQQQQQQLQQQQQQSSKSDSQSTHKPPTASKISNENHRNPEINQPKPDVDDSASKIPIEDVPQRTNRHDSGSKVPNDSAHRGKNHYRHINQLKPELTPHDSALKNADNHPIVERKNHNTDQSNSKPSTNKNSSRVQNPRFVTEQIPTRGSTPLLEPEPEKKQKQHRYDYSHPIVEKKEHETDQLNRKLSTKKNGYRSRNPRFVTEQITTGGSTQLLEPEPESVQKKNQHHRYNDNQPIVETDQSDSKLSTKKNSTRGRNPRFVAEQIPTGGNTQLLEPEPVKKKKHRKKQKHHRNEVNNPIVGKQEDESDQSNSKPSKTKNNSKNQNPRFVTDHIPTGDSTPEPVKKQKQKQYDGGRNGNQEVREHKGKMPELESDVVVDAVVAAAAAVKEVSVADVSRRSNGGWGSRSFHGQRRTGWEKNGQMTTAVWIRKGEIAPN